LHPVIKETIESNAKITMLFNLMFSHIPKKYNQTPTHHHQVRNCHHMFRLINHILTKAPELMKLDWWVLANGNSWWVCCLVIVNACESAPYAIARNVKNVINSG